MPKVLLISLKPEFADKILDGTKSIELRKCTPKVEIGDLVIIYTTAPIKEFVGICEVKEIIKMSPSKMWDNYSALLGIDYIRYKQYYKDSKIAVGIKLGILTKFDVGIPLSLVKSYFPKFSPPQTYKYFEWRDDLKSDTKKLSNKAKRSYYSKLNNNFYIKSLLKRA
jgi:predicted transcriptional regulator